MTSDVPPTLDVPPPDETRRLADLLLGGGHLEGADLLAERTRVGRYEIERLLGEGAFGRVYLARDPELHRGVAVKVLTGSSEERVARFLQERRVMAALKHPNIVEVFDAGTEDDEPFLVMEYVEGPTLDDARLDARSAARTLQQVALACQFAHEQGVIHHDLKPGNILMGERPVVTDFGVAKVLEDPGRTRTGQIVGTPTYMAPEQINGTRDDPRTDVYALGAILYELLTGRPPYTGANLLQVLARVAESSPTPPREVASDVDPGLEAIVMRAMERDPEDRYGSARELAAALSKWSRANGGSSVTTGAPRWLFPAVIGVAVLLLGVFGTRAFLRHRAAPTLDPLIAGLDGLAAWEIAPAGEGEIALDSLELIATDLRSILASKPAPARARQAQVGLATILVHTGRGEAATSLLGEAGPPASQLLKARLAWDEVLRRGLLEAKSSGLEMRAALEASLASGNRPEARAFAGAWIQALAGIEAKDGQFTEALTLLVNQAAAEGRWAHEAALLRAQLLLLWGREEEAREASAPALAWRATRARALQLESLSRSKEVSGGDADALKRALVPALRAVALVPADLGSYEILLQLARLAPRDLFRISLGEHLPALEAGRASRPGDVSVLVVLGFVATGEGYQRVNGGEAADPVLAQGIEALEEAARQDPSGRSATILALSYAVRALDERRRGVSSVESARLAEVNLQRAGRSSRGKGQLQRVQGLVHRLLEEGPR